MDARRENAVTLARSGRKDLTSPQDQETRMLDAGLKSQLKGYLDRLTQPVEIVASLDDGDGSLEMLELLEDIASSSPLVSLETRRNDGELSPSFTVRRSGQEAQVRFAGLPLGHEFSSLVLA